MVLETPFWWMQFVFAWWILFPAYAANVFPPLAKGRLPLDFWKKMPDGRRIFGDHKTVEGFGMGVIAGTLIGLLEAYLEPQLNVFASRWGVALPHMTALGAFMIGLGAMLGDVTGSFIKRRMNLQPGAKAPLLDQLNFIVGAVFFSMWFVPITLWMFLVMIIFTPLMHRTVNIMAYKMNAKKVPW
ncbi:MAG: CDP-2,3-bis-(O-geranylgeranyl)-sn-glycerol synthase [Candidatus Aenigmatarchaeota archaeon]